VHHRGLPDRRPDPEPGQTAGRDPATAPGHPKMNRLRKAPRSSQEARSAPGWYQGSQMVFRSLVEAINRSDLKPNRTYGFWTDRQPGGGGGSAAWLAGVGRPMPGAWLAKKRPLPPPPLTLAMGVSPKTFPRFSRTFPYFFGDCVSVH